MSHLIVVAHLEYGRRRCRASHLGHIGGRQQASWNSTCSKSLVYRRASYSLRSKAAGRTAHFMSLVSHLIFLAEDLIFVASAYGMSCRIARNASHLAHRACHLCRLRSLSRMGLRVCVSPLLGLPSVAVAKRVGASNLRVLCRACPLLP